MTRAVVVAVAVAVAMAASATASAQTRPQPQQIQPTQVRINGGDNRPGTLVHSSMIASGRHTRFLGALYYSTSSTAETWPADTPRNYPIICIYTVISVRTQSREIYTAWTPVCYSKIGQDLLLANHPDWRTWYLQQPPPPPPPWP